MNGKDNHTSYPTAKYSEKLRQLAKEWRELAEEETPSDTETESMLRLMMASVANQLEALISDVEELEKENQSSNTTAKKGGE